ncbi:MAG: acyltransferase family protein [Sphingomonadales bacterium]
MSFESASRRAFPGLDLVRFFAALLVVGYHLGFWWWVSTNGHGGSLLGSDLAWLAPLAASGWVGVEIFFVLSGFVIAFSAEAKTARQFFESRALRLYPAAWICATITLPTIGIAGRSGDYLRSLLLWPTGPWVSTVYWTLGVEICFYLLVGLTLLVWGARRLVTLGMVLGIVSSLYWLSRAANFVAGGPFKPVFQSFDALRQIGELSLLPSGCLFGLGMMAREASRQRLSGPESCVAAMCLIGSMIAVAGRAHLFAGYYERPQVAVVAPLLWLAAMLAAWASIRGARSPRPLLARHAATARAVGLMTYPLYLVHHELGHTLMLGIASVGGTVAFLLAGGAMILLAFAIAWLERWPRALLAAAFDRIRGGGAAAGGSAGRTSRPPATDNPG